jgi:hypothetical protein
MKRQNNLQATRTALICVASAISLHAAGLDYLAAKADAIVIGSISSRAESSTDVSFTINVSRILSGNVSGQTVSIIHPWVGLLRGTTSSTINQPLSGIWFLKMGSSGTWDVLTVRGTWARTVLGLFLPGLPTPPSPPYVYAADTPTVDALVYEVAAAFQSANNQDPDPRWLLGSLYMIDSPAVRSVLTTFSASGEPTLQTIALAGKLERSIPGAISSLVSLMPSLSINDPNRPLIVSALRDLWRDSTPAAIQQLVSYAAGLHTGSDIRAAAIRALAAIHTKATLRFLAYLLSSDDAAEQERAVYGLSSFANGCSMQTPANVVSMAYLNCVEPSTYKTAETAKNFAFQQAPLNARSARLTFWQGWWAAHEELH